MMNPEDQSHRFVITGQDPEGRSRTIPHLAETILTFTGEVDKPEPS